MNKQTVLIVIGLILIVLVSFKIGYSMGFNYAIDTLDYAIDTLETCSDSLSHCVDLYSQCAGGD